MRETTCYLALLLSACDRNAAVSDRPSSPPPPLAASEETTSAKLPPSPGDATKPGAGAVSSRRASPALLLQPARLTKKAPERFQVKFATSKGEFVTEIVRAWAPRAADRFFNLVQAHYFDGMRFSRVLRGVNVEFGISGDPTVSAAWLGARIIDDPPGRTNSRGTLSFVSAGPTTRTTRIIINLADAPALDRAGSVPFGRVLTGMDVVDYLSTGAPAKHVRGQANPSLARLLTEGDAYLARDFPDGDLIASAALP